MQRRPPSLELPFVSAVPEVIAPKADEPIVPPVPERRLYSVAEFDRRLKALIERATNDVDLEGEISGLRVVASGHTYFTLKDEGEEASIDCVMYRAAPARARKLLADGARVVVSGRATVYAARGRLQFIAESARLSGRGALLEALEQLKEKLAQEGLFAAARKRPLPADAKVIGVVTSGDGAAIHDIIKVAARRASVRILLARAPVQGAGAAERMVRALELLEQVAEVDAIILGRGGGSADDLSQYNDEALVRKVARLRVPVVSAVGHEIDVTLTDLAADARAATPSQAAELLVPDDLARREALDHLSRRLTRAIRHALAAGSHALDRLRVGLGSPERLIADRQQGLDELRLRLRDEARRLFIRRRAELASVERRFALCHPQSVIALGRSALGPLSVRLDAAMRRRLASERRVVATVAASLDALSPLAVLARGYAIVADAHGHALVDAAGVRAGDRLDVRLHRGKLLAQVIEHAADDPEPRP